jgi:hypothetical protein
MALHLSLAGFAERDHPPLRLPIHIHAHKVPTADQAECDLPDFLVIEPVVGRRGVRSVKQDFRQREGDTMVRLIDRVVGRIEDVLHGTGIRLWRSFFKA